MNTFVSCEATVPFQRLALRAMSLCCHTSRTPYLPFSPSWAKSAVMGLCNPELTALLSERIGGDFLKDLDKLAGLKGQIDDELVDRFNAVKRVKKQHG